MAFKKYLEGTNKMPCKSSKLKDKYIPCNFPVEHLNISDMMSYWQEIILQYDNSKVKVWFAKVRGPS